MRKSCKIAAKVLAFAESLVKPGLTTRELDGLVFAEIARRGAFPSPLGYRGFPNSVCTSVNNVLAHGIPDDRPLKNGDIVNVDVTVYYDG